MRKITTFTFLALSFFFFSCETEIKTNAEYKDMTVVYGLLNPSETDHYIKINKGFIGEGSANDLAANASNYNYSEGEISVKVEEYTSSNVFVKSYSLQRTLNEVPKENGVFDNTTNVLYKFTEPSLNSNNIFKLSIYNPSLDKVISSETAIPKGAKVSSASTTDFNTLNFFNGSSYTPENIKVKEGENVGRIKASLVFSYMEVYTNGQDSVEKSFRISMGEELANLNDIDLEFYLTGDVFFDAISNNVAANIPFLDYRRLNSCKIELISAGVDMSTYMSVNAPSNTSSVDFTNISNGLGLFSSRNVQLEKSNRPDFGETGYDGRINLGDETIKKILTMGLNFCSPRSAGANPPAPICWQ
ncbi:DUF4249 family protein [Vicingus serpentipes]|uniref:DUF4249 family protein n=1 Tax=Vicingus serpentipes TaxID=1926625 RepID=A0A5C6RW09_9FLAO|nr:DUF4249 family protein [Vicingus serpentipes]TXB66079.1 DUF4249 family protein [Vicingus serpentipes]